MVEEKVSNFNTGVVLFVCAIGILGLGLIDRAYNLGPFGYNWFAVLFLTGVCGFGALVLMLWGED
jgi:hypothetical protein